MAKKTYDYTKKDTSSHDIEVVDANNNQLQPGDSIIAIKGLPVKGGTDIKQGEKFTNITFTDDPLLVSGKHPKNGKMFLKTEFFRKG